MVAQDVGALEPMGQHELFVVEHFRRRAVCYHHAAIENDHSGAQADDPLQVVGRDELGRGNALQELLEFAAAARIEIRW